MGCGCGKSSFSSPRNGARTSAMPNTRTAQGPVTSTASTSYGTMSVVRSMGVSGSGVNQSPVTRRQV